MASFFSRSKRASEQKRNNRSSSLLASPNISVTTLQESRRSTSRHLFNSTLNSSYEDYTRNESFDVLPKTDYTYARSGSYSPRHLKKTYVNPNMSRQRLRGIVTPPVSMLDDSDSDMDLNDQLDYGQSVGIEQHTDASTTVSHTHSSTSATADYRASYASLYETDHLDFDSDEGDLDSGEPVVASSIHMKKKEQADIENMRIQQTRHSQDSGYRHYYEGMVLRSGSHLKGVKRFLDSKDHGRRKSTSVINHSSTDWTGNAQGVRGTSSVSDVYDQQQRSDNPAYDAGLTTTTTITKTVTEIEDDELNKNNNARARRRTRSPAKSGRGSTIRHIEPGYDTEAERKRISDEYQKEKTHRLDHMYGLDQADDFSDSDSYSYTSSSFTSSDDYIKFQRRRNNGFVRLLLYVLTMVTTAVESLRRMAKPVTKPVWHYVIAPVHKRVTKSSHWLWKRATKVARYFILLDAWMLSRNRRRCCCLCLPLILLLPLLLAGGQYVTTKVSSESSFFAFPSMFFSQQHSTYIREGDTLQTINLHQEVKHILQQLHSETRDWLTKREIESLVQSMINPEMESLRVSLLNIASEGSSDQAALKVDQNDAKLRLVAIEKQMAALQAKAKILEGDLADSKSLFVGSLTTDREKQSAHLASIERALADLRAQVDSLQGAYNAVADRSKNCCINDTALIAAIRDNVNHILAEMFSKDGKGSGAGSGAGAFAGWLNQNYVDRSEFEKQLRVLTADITNRISAGVDAQRSGHSSSFVLPSGARSLSEDAVKLIVEDALLKYSADRTGLPDYALESAGGSVLSVRCSETYYKKTALISVFGIPLWYTSNSPRTVIQPEVHPGQCWAFKGESGYIVIQLSAPVRPTGFSLEHIPKSLSMTGSIDSAPRDFTVFGLSSDTDTVGVNLGNFTYQTAGRPIQHFDVQIRSPGVFGYIELRVLNNHGNKYYTCLYRFRVHGVPSN